LKIYSQLSEFKKLSNAVVTIGTFDGVHYGHQKIIKRLCELAKSSGGESVILTFFPHPRMIIDPENQDLKLINTIKEKAEILAELGVDHLIITPFTRDFSNLSATAYIRDILVDQIGTKQIIVGYDHRFGKDRKGGMDDLIALSKVYDYAIEEIPEQDINDVAVSSTKIRTALLDGDVSLAAEYLGYHFSINGPVIKGDKIGRTIGFPTANIFVEETYKLIPSDGIYAVTIEMAEEFGEESLELGDKTPNPQLLKGWLTLGKDQL
jgi:riboflavin kinase/FMN adenylyltransferase